MKKTIFSLLLLLFAGAAYSQPQVCAVTGTFYDFDGTTADSIEIKIVQVFDSSGSLIYSKPITYRTGGAFSATPGVVTFNILRNSVAYIAARAMGWDSYGSYGRPVTIPNAASGNLATFVSPTAIPESTPVVLPVQLFFDSTGNTIFYSDTLWLGAGLAAVPKGNGSNDYTVISTVTGGNDTTGTTNRPEMTRIETDIANHADSLQRLDSLARLALANAATAIHKADSARNAVIAAIEADIANLTGRLDTAGTYDRVYLYGQIGNLYDSLGTLLALINTKVSADTAALTYLLDAVYARSGGASVWTQQPNWIEYNGLVTIGGTGSPYDHQSGVYFPRNIRQHPDSMLASGRLKTQIIVYDTLAVYSTDSLRVRVLRVHLPIAALQAPASHRMGRIEFEIYPSFLALYGRITDWAVVADSVNGVKLHRLSYSITAGRQNYFTSSTTYHTGVVSLSSVPISFVSPVYIDVNWMDTGIGTASSCVIQSKINDWNREQKILLAVDFLTTASGNSDWWVKIANN